MFQSFEPPARSASTSEVLSALREEMITADIDWFLVPHADEHQNEYLPRRAERLAHVTGFTGSAGFALIGLSSAYLFVDGRYTAQAASQVDTDLFSIESLMETPPVKFAAECILANQRIAYDPWLMTIGQMADWQKLADDNSAELKAVDNLIDIVWADQPPVPTGRAWLHPVELSGRRASRKLEDIRQQLSPDKADFYLQTDPASLAWTFNIRGSDLIHNPLALGWSLIPADASIRPEIFINPEKFSNEDLKALSALADLHDPSELEQRLAAISPDRAIHCDPALVASRLGNVITENGGTLIRKRDPVSLLRAVKNSVELEGSRQAHLRDGVAMVRFLAWLAEQPGGSVDEITAAEKLEQFRSQTATALGSELREISFDTISGAGANGAIVHYRVTRTTNATLARDSLYLVDSGGQYPDGTTDITRTVAVGIPPEEAVQDNTLVLKGHVAIARARFPEGTRGVDLDGVARYALWQAGKDYAHGTGHGIGSYLNVHEGPQSISRRGMEPLKPGMIISNEPGYYREGAYGIRIENLVIVREASVPAEAERPMLEFETITLCPYDRQLIDTTLLSDDERQWIDTYHQRVFDELSPHLDPQTQSWLKNATAPL